MLKATALIIFLCLISMTGYAKDQIPLTIRDNITIHPHLKQKDTIKCSFPLIEGKNLSKNEIEFNQLIQKFISDQTEKFNKNAGSKQSNSYIRGNYHLYYSIPSHHKIISVLFEIETMISGDAHPTDTLQSFNYDLTSGTLLSINDLFEPHSHPVVPIAEYCKKELTSKIKPSEIFAAALEPNSENYQVWNLKAAGILITFPQATVAPRIYGKQAIMIPYTALESVPLSPLVQSCAHQPQTCVAPSN